MPAYGLNVYLLSASYRAFWNTGSPRANDDAVALYIALPILLFLFVWLFMFIRRCIRFSRLALPDYLPAEEPPDHARFGKTKGYFGGSYLLGVRFLGLPFAVLGKGHSTKGGGKLWLGREAMFLGLYLVRQLVVIPYALVHSIDISKGLFYGKSMGVNLNYLKIT